VAALGRDTTHGPRISFSVEAFMLEQQTLRTKLPVRTAEPPPTPAVRHLSGRVCVVHPARGDGPRAGVVRDISQSHFGLLLPCEVPPGESLSVQPLRGDRNQTLQARVLGSSHLEDGWLHECDLAQPLGEQELQSWLP